MFLANHQQTLGRALSGEQPLNGMYLIYTAGSSDQLPTVNSTTTLPQLVEAVANAGASVGLVGVNNISTMPTSGGVMFVANTYNNVAVTGLVFAPGVYARAIGLVNLTQTSPTVYSLNTGLDYNEFSGTSITVVPANGSITLIDEVTI